MRPVFSEYMHTLNLFVFEIYVNKRLENKLQGLWNCLKIYMKGDNPTIAMFREIHYVYNIKLYKVKEVDN